MQEQKLNRRLPEPISNQLGLYNPEPICLWICFVHNLLGDADHNIASSKKNGAFIYASALQRLGQGMP